jgi:hypothetical protein
MLATLSSKVGGVISGKATLEPMRLAELISPDQKQWMIEYNEQRPHDALGKIPPAAFRKKVEAENSTYELST